MNNTDPRLNRAVNEMLLKDKEGHDVVLRSRPMSDRDITEMDNWVRARFVQIARDSLRPSDTAETRDRVERLAMEKAFGLTFMSGEGARLVGTVEGVARLVWQCCKVEHPDLTPDQVRDLLFNDVNIREAQRVWRTQNLGRSDPTVQTVPPNRKARRAASVKKKAARKSTASSRGSTGGRSTKSPR